LDDAPLIVGDRMKLSQGIVADGAPMQRFLASNLIYQDKYKDLQLVPFYKLFDTRYVVYWPYTSPDKLQDVLKAAKIKEEIAAKLEASTIDLVNTGEQQPETDHQFKGENTEVGSFLERHYRTAKGWFSYTLKNGGRLAKKLSVTYHGADRNRRFDVLVNGKLLATVELDGTKGKQFYAEEYLLPADFKEEELEVKFVAKANASVANVFEVRLMR
jgi:hypothetical protein